jgi:hypothetical protein
MTQKYRTTSIYTNLTSSEQKGKAILDRDPLTLAWEM